jgi:hypothetical protein
VNDDPDSNIHVLIVDDDPDSTETLCRELSEQPRLSITRRYPSDIKLEDLRNASLIIVDFVLSHGQWVDEHEKVEVARRPRNGLALAGVLRSLVDNRFDPGIPPKAFALLTAEVRKLAYDKPLLDRRLHSLARLNDLEWVFDKQDDAATNARGIRSLSEAVSKIVGAGPRDSATKPRLVAELLGLPGDAVDLNNESWESRAWATVLDAYPPINDYYDESTGFSFVRWLLQRVLPFICFLLPDFAVAARLNVTRDWLDGEVAAQSKFGMEFQKYRYQGILHDFGVTHYWRLGVEETLGTLGVAEPLNWKLVHEQLEPYCATPPTKTGLDRPIAVLNEHLLYTGDVAELRDCGQLSPDDWPGFADAPYARASLIDSDNGLRTLKIVSP